MHHIDGAAPPNQAHDATINNQHDGQHALGANNSVGSLPVKPRMTDPESSVSARLFGRWRASRNELPSV